MFPPRLRVPTESIWLVKWGHVLEPESHGVGKRTQHLRCLFAPEVMATSPKENGCSRLKHPLLSHCSDSRGAGRERRRAVLQVQAKKPVLTGKTKGTCGILRSEQAAARSKTTAMKRAEAGSECVLLSEAVKHRMTNRAALPRTEGDSGLWAFSSPTGKQPGEPGHIGPRGKWRHPVGTGRTGLREGSDWTTPQGGTWISWFWKASSDKFQKTIKEMLTITDFPPPPLPLQALR